MLKALTLILVQTIVIHYVHAQPKREDMYSDFVLHQKRIALEKDLRERVIAKAFSLPLDSNTEYKYANACDAITQFGITNEMVEKGLRKLFSYYDTLGFDTKKNFLEAVYGNYPARYKEEILAITGKEQNPQLFSICAAYLYRINRSVSNTNDLKIKMVEKFPGYDTIPVLMELEKYLSYENAFEHQKTPDLIDLFRYQKTIGKKIIYSFHRYNRDFAGLAIVQNADGSFVKNSDGSLAVFEQLARSGSNLPYFLNNGNTPQGVYSIQGTAVSHNNFIGPTPNLQMLIPFENKWEKYFHQDEVTSQDSFQLYKKLLPPGWRNYEPMMEAWYAGKTGRREIITHGSTIDPDFFKNKPFYPLTPSQGCLSSKELWNVTNGRLLVSEQLNLVTAFRSTPGLKGFLYVINLGNQQKAVSKAELETLVRFFEKFR